jgi:hypothetical protein
MAALTQTQSYTLTAGAAPGEVAVDAITGSVAYTNGESGVQEYHLRLPLDAPTAVAKINVWLMETAPLTIQAATLFDARTGMFQALLPSDRGRFRLVHSGDVKIYENLDRLPRAWLAGAAQPVVDADAALARLRAGEAAPLIAPLVEGQTLLPPTAGAAPGRAEILRYTPEEVVIESQSAIPALLVLSDAYYPGWRATVDGAPAPILPTNILFRGVEVPAGDHTVVFTFAPDSWRNGLYVGALGLVLWLAALAVGWRQNGQR